MHLVHALAAISNVSIAPGDSVNELTCSIVANSIPNFTGFSEDDGSGGALHPNSRISLFLLANTLFLLAMLFSPQKQKIN